MSYPKLLQLLKKIYWIYKDLADKVLTTYKMVWELNILIPNLYGIKDRWILL